MKKSTFFLLLSLLGHCFAQSPVSLAPLPGPFFYTNGPLTGGALAFGCVFTYLSGTNTPATTYTDYTGNTANPNPVVLNAGGYAQIWYQGGQEYSIKVVSSGGVNCVSGQTQYSASGINTSLLNLANTWQQPQTFDDPIYLLPADSQIIFGASSGSLTTLDIPPTTGNYILHGPPITGNDTLVSDNATQTLTNKSLTDPLVNGCDVAYGPGTYLCIPNGSSPGTLAATLTKLVGAPSEASVVSGTDTAGIQGIAVAGAGNSGTVTIQQTGSSLCFFDFSTTAGDYIVTSTSFAGACHDAGFGPPSAPPAGTQVVGQVLASAAGTFIYEPVVLYPLTATNASPTVCTSATPVTVNFSTTQQNLMSCVIPANSLNAGSLLEIKFQGVVTVASSSFVHNLYVSLGGSNPCQIQVTLPGAANYQPWNEVVDLAVITNGTGGTGNMSCEYFGYGDVAFSYGFVGTPTIPINTTIANTLQISTEQGTASSSSSITEQILKALVF